MMIARLVVTLTVLVPLVAGCSASKDVAQGDEAVADSLRYGKAVYVLIDGRDAGTVPKTIRLYRSYGTREVSLFQRGKEIRKYEIGIAATAAGEQAVWDSGATVRRTGRPTMCVHYRTRDEVYLIPFPRRPCGSRTTSMG